LFLGCFTLGITSRLSTKILFLGCTNAARPPLLVYPPTMSVFEIVTQSNFVEKYFPKKDLRAQYQDITPHTEKYSASTTTKGTCFSPRSTPQGGCGSALRASGGPETTLGDSHRLSRALGGAPGGSPRIPGLRRVPPAIPLARLVAREKWC
jgi:hypothetical protein